METDKEYPVYTFEAKDQTINGRYFVAANDENSAKKYVNEINHNVSPIKIDIRSCTEFKNLKYIFFKRYIFKNICMYLFGCTGSHWWHANS